VVDSSQQQINTDALPRDALMLVTCYPFNGLEANGPLRFVVEARAVGNDPMAALVES
jgi:sortase A